MLAKRTYIWEGVDACTEYIREYESGAGGAPAVLAMVRHTIADSNSGCMHIGRRDGDGGRSRTRESAVWSSLGAAEEGEATGGAVEGVEV